jgi:hypothetical protein
VNKKSPPQAGPAVRLVQRIRTLKLALKRRDVSRNRELQMQFREQQSRRLRAQVQLGQAKNAIARRELKAIETWEHAITDRVVTVRGNLLRLPRRVAIEIEGVEREVMAQTLKLALAEALSSLEGRHPEARSEKRSSLDAQMKEALGFERAEDLNRNGLTQNTLPTALVGARKKVPTRVVAGMMP